MRWMDYALQRWRGSIAQKYIRPGDTLLDIGCYDGLLLAQLQHRVSYSIGIDREIPEVVIPEARKQLAVSDVTKGLPFSNQSFDSVSLLAVFEHLPDKTQAIKEIARVLRPGGRVVLTVPGNQVDNVLKVLIGIGVADGMSLQEHHGYRAIDTPELFEAQGLYLKVWRQFQLGLNNLFLFEKSPES